MALPRRPIPPPSTGQTCNRCKQHEKRFSLIVGSGLSLFFCPECDLITPEDIKDHCPYELVLPRLGNLGTATEYRKKFPHFRPFQPGHQQMPSKKSMTLPAKPWPPILP